MGRLFGTDGIRGIAGKDPITAETGIRLGRAIVKFCRDRDLSTDIVIGRDTRISGEELEQAVAQGVASAGGDAYCIGVIPTPGIARLALEMKAGAGVVLSASHNPWDYNGFKLFLGTGFKLSDDEEAEIESLILDSPVKASANEGAIHDAQERVQDYISFIKSTLPDPGEVKKLKVVLDCSNGAASSIASKVYRDLGIETEIIFDQPDGRNINLDCGSQHTHGLSKKVLETVADIGLAFDGDADRLIAVD